MESCRIKIIFLVSLVVTTCACKRKSATVESAPLAGPSIATDARALARGNDSTMMAVSFLEERVKSDPDDIVALNKLSNYYLQLHRETDDVEYLAQALRAAQSSLRVLPPDQNLGGLRALAQSEYETHDFLGARDHAQELTEYEPRRSFGFQLLGDAQLELGEYDKATAAYERMEHLEGNTVATETRLARLAMLRGDVATARSKHSNALAQAKGASAPSAETIAWCNWQLGELAKAAGDYDLSVRCYRDALAAFPDYRHATASLAQLRASQGDLKGAIKVFERLVSKHSDPIDAATLGDLYELDGRDADAQKQYSAVAQLSQQSGLYSALFNRHLVLFWADHDLRPEDAYAKAKHEYQTRRDIYGADALAWAALKAGNLDEAQSAIKDALRLGTQDARLFYHAGMIARATGDRTAAIDYLTLAIRLNPHFDPWPSRLARKALAELEGAESAGLQF